MGTVVVQEIGFLVFPMVCLACQDVSETKGADVSAANRSRQPIRQTVLKVPCRLDEFFVFRNRVRR